MTPTQNTGRETSGFAPVDSLRLSGNSTGKAIQDTLTSRTMTVQHLTPLQDGPCNAINKGGWAREQEPAASKPECRADRNTKHVQV